MSLKTILALTVLASAAAIAAPAGAQAPITVILKDHRFSPAEIKVAANQPVILNVINQDPLAEEFDSTALKVEKVIAGKQSGTVRIHPLRPGRYPFMGEYHSATAQGVVVAQ